MDPVVKRIREYIHDNVQRYLLFKLFTMLMRILGLILVWSTVAYYIAFSTLGVLAIGLAMVLYILLEAGDFSHQKRRFENLLSEGGAKWFLS